MNRTQSFRLPGKAEKKIPCSHVNGHSVIYWHDIEHSFPGVKHVKNGKAIVQLMRTSKRKKQVDGFVSMDSIQLVMKWTIASVY